MSETVPTPEKIWIITAETSQQKNTTGKRGGEDIGGTLSGEAETLETATTEAKAVDVAKLKREMQGFLQAMREMLDEADPPEAKIRLDEVELSVEINGEGQVSLFGVGGKAGGKGAMTFKFKRR